MKNIHIVRCVDERAATSGYKPHPAIKFGLRDATSDYGGLPG